jgi:hypothetical protein
MAGWNLPPGCSISDIPGNRPEDEAEEALYDAIYEAYGCDSLDDATADRLVAVVKKAWADGYAQGQSDVAKGI